MGLADELIKLKELRDAGALTDAEFDAAKARLLRHPPAAAADRVAQAMQNWVDYKILSGVIGGIFAFVLLLLIVFAVVIPGCAERDHRSQPHTITIDGQRHTVFR